MDLRTLIVYCVLLHARNMKNKARLLHEKRQHSSKKADPCGREIFFQFFFGFDFSRSLCGRKSVEISFQSVPFQDV
jgi:hypothetical protein